MIDTKHFQGGSFAECRGAWSRFCDERQPVELYVIRFDAHRAGGLHELSVTFTDDDPDEPNETEPRGPYEPIGYRTDMVAACRGHLLP